MVSDGDAQGRVSDGYVVEVEGGEGRRRGAAVQERHLAALEREVAVREELVGMAEAAVEVLRGMVFGEEAKGSPRVKLQAIKALFSVGGQVGRRLDEARRVEGLERMRAARGGAEGTVLEMDEELAGKAREGLRALLSEEEEEE